MNIAKLTISQLRGCKHMAAVFLFCAAMTIASSAQTLTRLANFHRFPQPGSPSILIQGFDGNFYGTTSAGAASGECQSGSQNGGCGTVFRLTPAGYLITLHSFCTQANCPDGQVPNSLLQATDGNLYGTTASGGAGCSTNSVPGCGTIFRINRAGEFSTLYSFCLQTNCPDGVGPNALVQAPSGVLYGTTSGGGANNYGSVFKATTAGKLTTLHSFNITDGAQPGYGLVLGSDGNIYGTTYYGGDVNCAFSSYVGGCGVVFKMTLGGSLKAIYSFCAVSYFCYDGANPTGLVEAADGNYYGTTYEGGTADSESQCGSGAEGFGCGTIFQVTPSGNLTTIYSVCSDNYCDLGSNPTAPMVLGNDGNLYGTTLNGGTEYGGQICTFACGTVFEITTSGSLTLLHDFNWTDGAFPTTLVQSTDGVFYGTTLNGGYGNYGTVYSLSTGLAPFVTADPGAAKVGAKVIINGTNLAGTTAVAFNGTTAQFKAVGKTALIAEVPVGATTGSITVTIPSDTLKTKVAFEVIH